MNDLRDSHGELLPDDQRQTKMTRLIRRLRLDELPQLWPVLTGQMALVGPRPLLPQTLADFGELGVLRNSVRPGLTGWAQVNFGYGVGVAGAREKLRYDLYYLKNMSPLLDLAIVAATLRAVVAGQGVR